MIVALDAFATCQGTVVGLQKLMRCPFVASRNSSDHNIRGFPTLRVPTSNVRQEQVIEKYKEAAECSLSPLVRRILGFLNAELDPAVLEKSTVSPRTVQELTKDTF